MNRRLSYAAVIAAMTVSTAIGVAGGSATAARPAGPNHGGVLPAVTNVCANTFTSGSGPTAQSFCVTANGNIGQLSWRGVEQIRVGNFIEGYMVCVGDTVKAYDYEDYVESGFQAPTVSQPGGPNTLPLTITRRTADGSFSVAQTFSTSSATVTVSTALKNLSGANAFNVRYIRVADLDNGSSFTEEFSRSVDAVTANVENGTGTMMTTSSVGTLHSVYVSTSLPITCALTSDTTPETGDGVGEQAFDFASIANASIRKVNTIYRRF
jgi:hypothetical protein